MCIIYVITHSFCGILLRFSRRTMIRVLEKSDLARVGMSNREEIDTNMNEICLHFSMLNKVYAFADGLKLFLEQIGNEVIQEMF